MKLSVQVMTVSCFLFKTLPPFPVPQDCNLQSGNSSNNIYCKVQKINDSMISVLMLADVVNQLVKIFPAFIKPEGPLVLSKVHYHVYIKNYCWDFS
jgi:hypothetical protein